MTKGKCLSNIFGKLGKVCKTLSCQSDQTSPKRSIGNPLEVSDNSIVVTREEMGNKSLKLQDIDYSVYQESVLSIVKEQRNPRKETSFSPYAPLPAIGKSILTEEPKQKLVRQKTYRVLEPVYIKGPLDIYDFVRKTENQYKSRSRLIGIDKNISQCDTHQSNVVEGVNVSNQNLRRRNFKQAFNAGMSGKPYDKFRKELNPCESPGSRTDEKGNTTFWIDF